MLWDQPGVPHKGWRCIGVVDLGEDDPDYTPAICEMCRRAEIRYVHTMEHDDHRNLDVGCVCAEKMAIGYDGKRAEKTLRSKAAMKARWLNRKGWKTSKKGNPYIKVKGIVMIAYPGKLGRWSCRFGDRASKRWFATEDEAKLALFEEFWRVTYGG